MAQLIAFAGRSRRCSMFAPRRRAEGTGRPALPAAFYPADPKALTAMMDEMLAQAVAPPVD